MTTVCFDFDGVLAEYDGWKGHGIIGKPIKEMIDLVGRLHNAGHTLVLCTTRLNAHPFVDMPNKVDKEVVSGYADVCIREFLEGEGILTFFSKIGCEKVFADYYIDDRAIRYSIVKDKYGGQLGVELYQLLLGACHEEKDD